jgi:hypothetical protein
MVGDALTRNEGTEATTGPARLRRRGLAVLCLVTLALLAGGAQAASGNLDLVSRASGASGAKGNGLSKVIGISGDGRFVAFSSLATNLSPDDGDATYDSYVRDLQTGTTTLVCRASGADGAKGNGASADGAVSADGRFVAFESGATNLDPDDGDAIFDAYVRDLQTNTTTLVSRASGASGPKGNADSIVFANAISSDGRFVAFASRATNLSPDDGDQTSDVFVRDLQTDATTLVSRAAGSSGAKGNGDSYAAYLSGDGRFVAFGSQATNLSADDGDAITDVFRRDLANSQPVAAADAYTAEANTPLTVAAPGVLANDSDPDGDPLSARPVSGPEHGTLALNADGSFVHARGAATPARTPSATRRATAASTRTPPRWRSRSTRLRRRLRRRLHRRLHRLHRLLLPRRRRPHRSGSARDARRRSSAPPATTSSTGRREPT